MNAYKLLLELYSRNPNRFFVYLNEYAVTTFIDPSLELVPEL